MINDSLYMIIISLCVSGGCRYQCLIYTYSGVVSFKKVLFTLPLSPYLSGENIFFTYPPPKKFFYFLFHTSTTVPWIKKRMDM